MATHSLFIVIEGIDGSGKSTVARQLAQVLQSSTGGEVKLTFEPHDQSAGGTFIRRVLTKEIRNVSSGTLALAFALNRADHCEREIAPFLSPKSGGKGAKKGAAKVVLCDRYLLSSLVYQSEGDIGFEDVMRLNQFAMKPDLTIFMDASVKTCHERMRNRAADRELFEENLAEFRAKYFRAADFLRDAGQEVQIVDANGGPDEVLGRVIAAVKKTAPEWLAANMPPVPH